MRFPKLQQPELEYRAKLVEIALSDTSTVELLTNFVDDAIDNREFMARGKLKMPVLAIGGEKSFGKGVAEIMRHAASDVREGVIPDSGHWIMEENPTATVAVVRAFLDAKAP